MCSALVACVVLFITHPVVRGVPSKHPIMCFDDYDHYGASTTKPKLGYEELTLRAPGSESPQPGPNMSFQTPGTVELHGGPALEGWTVRAPSSDWPQPGPEPTGTDPPQSFDGDIDGGPNAKKVLGFETPSTLEEAINVFKQHTRVVHPRNWENFQLYNFTLNANFYNSATAENGLAGNFTFSELYMVVTPPVRVTDKPSHTVVENGVDLNYKYQIGVGLECLYSVNVNSERMAGKYKAKFKDVDMNAGLHVTKGNDGKCQYEGKINIAPVPQSFEAAANTYAKLKSSDSTKKAEIIINTFVLHELLENKKIGIKDQILGIFTNSFDSEVGAMVKEDLKWDLCDFMK